MTQNTAFLTTVYPMPEKYLVQFFESLILQDYKDFDMIIVNDDYKGLEQLLKRYSQLNIVNIKGKNNIVKNRESAIKYACENGYENVIFGDADDYFSANRIQYSIDLLKDNDIVVNDLASVNSDGKIITNNIYSKRLKNFELIQSSFIQNKNIFGLSNTAVKTKFLSNIIFDLDVIALDWFIFTQILNNPNTKAIFTNKATTFYRQHTENTAGIEQVNNVENISHSIHIKKLHYQALSKINVSYKKLFHRYNELERMFLSNKAYKIKYTDDINITCPKPAFWWENS